MNLAPEYDPSRGIIRLPRSHLEGIVARDRDMLQQDTPRGRLLAELGVVGDGRIDGGLGRVLYTLRRPRRRFVLRCEEAGSVRVHRGWVCDTGVVTVSGGSEPEAVQDIRYAARATATTRVLAGLLDLGPRAPVACLPSESLPWEVVVQPVRERRAAGWARDAFGTSIPLRLDHLRWSNDGLTRATTMLVVLSTRTAGFAEAVPGDGGFGLVARTPTELWTGLCALVSRSDTGSRPRRAEPAA